MLNQLISRYLDGELSRDEDTLLRSMLAADPAAKEAFDAAIILHGMMKDDANSVHLPLDTAFRIEDALMEHIAQNAASVAVSQPIIPIPSTFYRKSRNPVLVLSALLIMIVSGRISDSDFLFQISGIASSKASNTASSSLSESQAFASALQQAEKSDIFHSKMQSKGVNRNSKAAQTIAQLSDDPSSRLAAVNTAQDITVQDESAITERSEKKSIYAYPGFDASVALPSAISQQRQLQNSGIAQSRLTNTSALTITPATTRENSPVSASAFAGTSVVFNSPNSNSQLLSISQSIAYDFTEADRVGVEIGYMGMGYQAQGRILVPVQTGTRSKVLGFDDSPIDASTGGTKGGAVQVKKNEFEYTSSSVHYNEDKSMYWGGAFYERALSSAGSPLSLHIRAGAGASADGAIGYGRVYARYTVLPGMAFSVGGDARAFTSRSVNQEAAALNTSTAVSVVYGLSVQF